VLDGGLFENVDDFRKKWVRNFGNDQSKNAAAPGNQCPRLRVREIAQFFDSPPHALGELGMHAGNAIDGPRHRRR